MVVHKTRKGTQKEESTKGTKGHKRGNHKKVESTKDTKNSKKLVFLRGGERGNGVVYGGPMAGEGESARRTGGRPGVAG